ncbi:hypothetical protein [Methylocaldum szegediense]|uniref:Uncharacterized protein n=1 Tax=Methylocaldum szegediense TaxID=73780 RepID=A0ABN8X2W9_9GAMM|nr:hypothetical protein [Methylocaldum szegediense]CAI8741504.1 protein of unknown function [Methylocaldum szegediense]
MLIRTRRLVIAAEIQVSRVKYGREGLETISESTWTAWLSGPGIPLLEIQGLEIVLVGLSL